MASKGRSGPRKGNRGLVVRPELKMFSGQFTSGLVAANAWTMHTLPDLIVPGNTASTRVGRIVRIVRARISIGWTPQDGNDLLHCMPLIVEDADLTTDAFSGSSTFNSFPIAGLAAPVGSPLLGNFPGLTGAQWQSTDTLVHTWDFGLNLTVRFDDASDVIGRSVQFGVNVNASSTSLAGNVVFWYYDA